MELAEEYANALDKSTSRPLSWREVFDHSAQHDVVSEAGLELETIVVVKRLSTRAISRSF
jgi:hypothetical protein